MKNIKEITANIIPKLKAIQGRELKYNQLCEALDLKPKTGNSKPTQIQNIGTFCELEQLERPTRYVVHEVYEDQFQAFLELNQQNRFQYYFEAALYQHFLKTGCKPIRASCADLLRIFNEVNDNFTFSGNKEILKKINPDYQYMTEINSIVYPILKQWTYRHIDSMEKRYVIIKRQGFRLYSAFFTKNGMGMKKIEVEENSEIEQKCLEVYNQAIEEIMPKDWALTKTYVPALKWMQFQIRLRELVKEKIGEEYDDINTIMIITPPTKEWVTKKLLELYERVEALPAIEKETIDKIMATSKLDDFTGEQKKTFISHHIKQNTPIDYRMLLNEK